MRHGMKCLDRDRDQALAEAKNQTALTKQLGYEPGVAGTTVGVHSATRNYRRASRLKEAAVVRMPSVYGVPAKPNSLANLLESKRYGPSLWYSIS